MTDEQKAAFIQSQAACAMIEAMGMQAANTRSQVVGGSTVFDQADFEALITRYVISHNAVIGLFRG